MRSGLIINEPLICDSIVNYRGYGIIKLRPGFKNDVNKIHRPSNDSNQFSSESQIGLIRFGYIAIPGRPPQNGENGRDTAVLAQNENDRKKVVPGTLSFCGDLAET